MGNPVRWLLALPQPAGESAMSGEKFGLLSLFQRGRAVALASADLRATPWVPPPASAAGTATAERALMVFAVDATASRVAAWEAAQQLTDALFAAVPGELDVALAVHGGSRVH